MEHVPKDATAVQKALILYTQLLFTGQRFFLADLVERFPWDKATILRIMRAIESSGIVEVETGMEKRQRWFQIRNLPGTPHVGLTAEDVEKLALCRDLMARLLPEGIEKSISNGIAKISMLMANAEHRAEASVQKVHLSRTGTAINTGLERHMEVLLRALSDRMICDVTYKEEEFRFPDRGRDPVAYKFLPVRLSTEKETLCVEGWKVENTISRELSHPMTFALHRIHACEATGICLPDYPELPVRKAAFGLVGFEEFPVRVSFSEEFAGYIRERFWSDGQEIVDLPDGEIELRFHASDESELVCWVLSFGNGAELLEPAHLREWIREELTDMQGYYEEEDGLV